MEIIEANEKKGNEETNEKKDDAKEKQREKKNLEEKQIQEDADLGKKFSHDKIVVTGLIGLVLILLNLILENFHFSEEYLRLLGHLSRDGGIAFLSAAIITYLIEIPSLLSYFKERIIDALKDTNYLSSLTNSDLEEIKEKCNKLLFQKHGKRKEAYLNDSLIEFENEVFHLLMKPYYEYFSVNVNCTDSSDIKFPGDLSFKKTIKTTFKMVNPIMGERTEKILSPLTFYCPNDFGQCDVLSKIIRLRVKIDRQENYLDYTNEVKSFIEDFSSTKYPNYNKRLFYKINDEEIKIPFSHEIIVDMEEVRYVSFDDKIFTKRVDKPTKNLSVHYSYDNPNFKIKADAFFTHPPLMADNIITAEYSNSVSIESKTWFLPGNGILIAIVPKETEGITVEVAANTQKDIKINIDVEAEGGG